MENEKYLSEEKYQKNNQQVKLVGKILLIVGIIILVVSYIMIFLGFMGFGNTAVESTKSFNDSFDFGKTAGDAFNNFGLFALGGFINSIGFILTVAGGIMLLIGHRREITAYTTQQVMPVAQEGIEKMAPTIGKAGSTITKEMASAYGDVAREISRGINEGKQDSENNK